MEYLKIMNLLDNTPNQPSKFRTKYWVEINDDASGPYDTNSQIKFKTSMLMSSYVCDYIVMLVSGLITITGEEDNDAAKRADEINEGVVFKTCEPFTYCISE